MDLHRCANIKMSAARLHTSMTKHLQQLATDIARRLCRYTKSTSAVKTQACHLRSVTGRPPLCWYTCSSSCTCAGSSANSSAAKSSLAVSRCMHVAALRASLSSGERSAVVAAVSTPGSRSVCLASHAGRPPMTVSAVPASLFIPAQDST